MSPADLSSHLAALGFTLTHEGGGLHVWTLPLARGLRLVLCDAQGDGEPSPDSPASLGLYCAEHGEALTQTEYPSGAEAVRTLELAGLIRHGEGKGVNSPAQ